MNDGRYPRVKLLVRLIVGNELVLEFCSTETIVGQTWRVPLDYWPWRRFAGAHYDEQPYFEVRVLEVAPA